MTTASVSGAPGHRDRHRELMAFGVFVAVAIGLLVWAKWWPYSIKIPKAADTHTLGTSILTGQSAAPPDFSLTAGLEFARTYFLSIWPALLAGLFIGAAVTVLVPKAWLLRALAKDGRASTLRGGLLSIPTMMCTCCTAPVAVGLRKRGASIGASIAFWLGNPALNPAVLALSFFVLGWKWTALRAAAGVLLILGVAAVTRYGSGVHGPTVATDDPETGPLSLRFGRAFGGMALRLLPEYLLLVVALGALRGPLFSGGIGLRAGVLAVVVFALAGALLPIPTAGEIPVVAALLILGVSAPVAAALLITLPAISVPSLVMVRRAFPAKVLATTTAAVIAMGLLTAAGAAVIGL